MSTLDSTVNLSFEVTKTAVHIGSYLSVITLVVAAYKYYQFQSQDNSYTTYNAKIYGGHTLMATPDAPLVGNFYVEKGCSAMTDKLCHDCADGCQVLVQTNPEESDRAYLGNVTVFAVTQNGQDIQVFFDRSTAKKLSPAEWQNKLGMAVTADQVKDFWWVKDMWEGQATQYDNAVADELIGVITSCMSIILFNWYLRSDKVSEYRNKGVESLIGVVGIGSFIAAVAAASSQ